MQGLRLQGRLFAVVAVVGIAGVVAPFAVARGTNSEEHQSGFEGRPDSGEYLGSIPGFVPAEPDFDRVMFDLHPERKDEEVRNFQAGTSAIFRHTDLKRNDGEWFFRWDGRYGFVEWEVEGRWTRRTAVEGAVRRTVPLTNEHRRWRFTAKAAGTR